MATLPPEHLVYPWRRNGMDHDRYDWSIMRRRPPVVWPGGAHLAVWIVAPLTWYPLDMAPQPRPPQGFFDDPFPNFRDYSHRDYGNRIGAFRIMQVLDRHGLRATAPTNAAICDRYPALVEAALMRNWEFMAHGIDMNHLHNADITAEHEAEMIARAVTTVRTATGQAVRGWLSPGNAESPRTLDLLAANGIDHVCDWVNDELPYRMRSSAGPLWAMPFPQDINDATIMWHGHHSPLEFVQQVCCQFDYLHAESLREGGRVFALCLHSWCIGQPHRIHALDSILRHIAGHAGVWPATASEILSAYRQRAGE